MPVFISKAKTHEEIQTNLLRRVKRENSGKLWNHQDSFFHIRLCEVSMSRIYFSVGSGIECKEYYINLNIIKNNGITVKIYYDVFEDDRNEGLVCREHFYKPMDIWYDCPKCCERGHPPTDL